MGESSENDTRMKKCSRFIYCNAPLCPLDALQSLRVGLPEDDKCTLPKSFRLRLGKGLPKHGLKSNEYRAILRLYGSIEAYISKKSPIHTNESQEPSNNTFSSIQEHITIENKEESA